MVILVHGLRDREELQLSQAVSTGFGLITFAMAVKCSTNVATQLGAGQFIGLMCSCESWWSIALVSQRELLRCLKIQLLKFPW